MAMLGRLRQENCEFEVSLCCIVRPLVVCVGGGENRKAKKKKVMIRREAESEGERE